MVLGIPAVVADWGYKQLQLQVAVVLVPASNPAWSRKVYLLSKLVDR